MIQRSTINIQLHWSTNQIKYHFTSFNKANLHNVCHISLLEIQISSIVTLSYNHKWKFEQLLSRPNPKICSGLTRDATTHMFIFHAPPSRHDPNTNQWFDNTLIFSFYVMVAYNLCVRLPTYPKAGSNHS